VTDERVFRGDLIHIGIANKIPLEQLKAFKGDEMTELGKLRIAEQMAKFLVKHFLSVENDGKDLTLDVRFTLLMSKAPPGLAKTTIVFREVPREPTATAELEAGGFAPRSDAPQDERDGPG
jgi:hypothetical protein